MLATKVTRIARTVITVASLVWLAVAAVAYQTISVAPAAVLMAAGICLAASVARERAKAAHTIAQQADALHEARAAVLALKSKLNDAGAQRAVVVAGIGRELRTPLTVMLASTRALMDGSFAVSGPALELAESAGRNASRIARLVDDVLLAAEDTAQTPRGIIEVSELLHESAAPFAGVDIFADGPLYAVGDDSRLRSTLERLIADAAPGRDAPVRVQATLDSAHINIEIQTMASGAPDGFGIYVAERLLAGTGAELFIDADASSIRISLPALSSAALTPRARWSSAPSAAAAAIA